MTALRALRKIKGPCLALAAGAALLFLSAGALFAAVPALPTFALPPRPWADSLGYSIQRRDSWYATEQALYEKYPEPDIPLTWFYKGPFDKGSSILNDPHSRFASGPWAPLRVSDSDRQAHRVVVPHNGNFPRYMLLKCVARVDKAARCRAFFSTNHYLALHHAGRLAWQGLFYSYPYLDERDAELDLAPGDNEIFLLVEVRKGGSLLYFRIGRTNTHLRKAAVLSVLQTLHPEDAERCLSAEHQIASILAGQLRDPENALAEYQCLYHMAGKSTSQKQLALRGFADVYRAVGLFPKEFQARDRAASLATDALPDPSPAALFRLAASASELGMLETASASVAAAFAEDPRSLDAFKALLEIDLAFSLRLKSMRLLDETSALAPGDDFQSQIAKARPRLAALKGDSAFLDLDYSASAALRTASRLAEAQVHDKAAVALLDALDSTGSSLVDSGASAESVSSLARSLLASDDRLLLAYRLLAATRSLPKGAFLLDVLARRPLTEGARSACLLFARRTASTGRYSLAALAAMECLDDFPADPEATALAVSSLCFLDRAAEARRILDRLSDSALDAVLPSGVPLRRFAPLHLPPPSMPSPSRETARPVPVSLKTVWTAPFHPANPFADPQEITRRYGPAPSAAAGVLENGRIYFTDGRKVFARDLRTGELLLERTIPLPPGVTHFPPGLAGSHPGPSAPLALALGPGAVYITAIARDDVTGRAATFVASLDCETGSALWTTSAASLDAALSFVSPPAWAHDRVYLLARSTGEVPPAYLVCLDALDGSPQFKTLLGSGYGSLSVLSYWSAPRPSPVGFVAPPVVTRDSVYAAPNIGVIAQVHPLTGRMKRAFTYDRPVLQSPASGLMYFLTHRPFSIPAVSGGTVALTPVDSVETFLLQQSAGYVTVSSPGTAEVAGFSGSNAVCVGDTIFGADSRTGRVTWRCKLSPRRFLPGALVVDGLVFVPCEDSLLVVSADHGDVAAQLPWPDGIPRGRLILDAGLLVAFSDNDVAVFSLSDSLHVVAAASRPSPPHGLPAPPPRSAAAMPGLYAAPMLPDDYLVDLAPSCEPVLFADGGREMLLLPGRDCICWDVEGATAAWSARLPFQPHGALYADQRVIVFDQFTVAALDSPTGRLLWQSQAPRAAPVEVRLRNPRIKAAVAAGRIALLVENTLRVIDAADGRPLHKETFLATDVVELTAGPDFFAAVTPGRYRHPRLVVYEAADLSVRLVEPLGDKPDATIALAARGDRIFAASPVSASVRCLDASTDALIWKKTKLPVLARVLDLDPRPPGKGIGPRLVYRALEKPDTQRLFVFAAASGNLLADWADTLIGTVGDDSFYAFNSKKRLYMHSIAPRKQLFRQDLHFVRDSESPLTFHKEGGFLYLLLGDPSASASTMLSLAKFNAESGQMLGQWNLPLRLSSNSPPSIVPLSGGSSLIVAQGFLRGPLASLCRDALIPQFSLSGRPPLGAPLGSAVTATLPAAPLPDLVIDGDLADWPDSSFSDVRAGASSPAARIAASPSRSGLTIALRTFAPPQAARRRYERLRLICAPLSPDASTPPALDLYLDDPPLAASFTSQRLPNDSGGFDYELEIPWTSLRLESASPDAVRLGLAAVGPRDADSWTWPANVTLTPRNLGLVTFSAP